MSRRARRTAALTVALSAGFAAALLAFPGRRELAVHLWLLGLVVLVALAALGHLREVIPRVPSAFDDALAPTARPPSRPATLGRLERELSMGSETAFDTHARLAPLFARLTDGILSTHHGTDLTRPTGRVLVSDELWALVRPRAEPERRTDPGVRLDTLERLVTELEELAWS